MKSKYNCNFPIQSVTEGPKHHYFGYYNITPWDITGRYMLALETDFCDRPQKQNDEACIGLIDTMDGNSWRHLARTHAWCWQQGCMLQWLPSQPDRCIVYNDVVNGNAVSVIRDVFSGETRTLPRPVYSISHDGRQALSLNFGRLQRTRPGYGYAGINAPSIDESSPQNDGIYWMDMETGESRLIISIRQLTEIYPLWSMRGAVHWVNHADFNTNDSRFAFYHRWEIKRGKLGSLCNRILRKLIRTVFPGMRLRPYRITRLLTARPDGSDIRILSDDDMVSHFDWKDSEQLFAWARVKSSGNHYYLFNDKTGHSKIIGEDVLSCDGHPSFSPDGKCILTDTYPDPDTHKRSLMLYGIIDDKKTEIGKFFSPPQLGEEIRCDLHPRWNRDGTKVCFDSFHDGSRQVYVVDIDKAVNDNHHPPQ